MSEKFTLIARRSDGCIVDALQGNSEQSQKTQQSRIVLDWTSRGLRVEKLASIEANRQLGECAARCPHLPPHAETLAPCKVVVQAPAQHSHTDGSCCGQ